MGQTLIIGTIYRPPGMDLSEFNTLLGEVLGKIQMERKLVIFWAIMILTYLTMGCIT